MTPDILARIHARAFTVDRPWTVTEFVDLLKDPQMILCGDARSFILGRVILDEAEVLTVATDPQFQRQGLAAAALRRFEAEARVKGATTVFLEVASDNHAAKALYRNENYADAGQRRGYYRRANGPAADAILMRKDLGHE